ncbi:MAG: ABC transporter ATP-binding protein [Bacteroidetes bacterium]|nr:ABC transporter ATP-binding protein [Bacteroidota bacterium]
MLSYFRIISYGKPYFWLGAVAVIALFVSTLFGAASLLSSIPFLEILFSDETLLSPAKPAAEAGFSSFKDYGYYYLQTLIIEYGKANTLLYFCFFLSVIILIKNGTRYLASYCMAPLEYGIIRRMRAHLFSHLTLLDLQYFAKRKKGDILSIMSGDLETIMQSVISTVQAVVREPLTLMVYLVTLLIISWELTLFSLIILPITGIAINFVVKPLKKEANLGQKILGELIAQIEEFLTSIRIVIGFQKEKFEQKRHDSLNDHYTNLQISIRRRVELASPLTEVLSILVVCIIIYFGGLLILESDGDLKPSEFIGFIAIFSQFLSPIKVISNTISKIQKGIAAFDRFETILNEIPRIQESDRAVPIPGFESEIRFDDVWFKYEDHFVLEGITFSLEKGKTVALVGASGAGKSTLADLLPRFYDPTKGKITLDGHDVRDIKLADLRRQIGMVSQEGFLFHDTVMNNIAYGIENPDREAVIEAAKVANAHEFIEQLPQGYDTILGERGTLISGGQRQRISIARAVFRNPSILILDEATSNLDTQSEKLVQQALENLMSNRTSLVIAHRLSTVLSADLIIILEKGKIVESGTHQELIELNGRYKSFYQIQFGA